MSTNLLRRVNHPLVYRYVAFAWLIFTSYLLFKPGLGFQQPLLFAGEDKLAHTLLFTNLTFLWALNFYSSLGLAANTVLRLVMIFGLFFAGLSEWIQDFIPHRAMDLADFLFDAVGICLGMLTFFFIEKTQNALLKS